jgi:anti-anti-sigma factor
MTDLRSSHAGDDVTDFHVRRASDGVLYVAGELDMASANRLLDDTLQRVDGERNLVLDLSELSFVDSTGVRTFLRLAKSVEPRSLVLRNPQGSVAHLFDVVRIESFGIQIEGRIEG